MMFRFLLFLSCLLLISCVSMPETHNPEAAKANAELGMAYLKSGDLDRAKSKLLEALREDPKNPLILDAFAYYSEKTGNAKVAEQYYRQAIDIDANNGAAHNNYGAYLCRNKRYHKAIDQFLIAAKNPNYLHPKKAYQNAAICATKIPIFCG